MYRCANPALRLQLINFFSFLNASINFISYKFYIVIIKSSMLIRELKHNLGIEIIQRTHPLPLSEVLSSSMKRLISRLGRILLLNRLSISNPN